VTSRWSPHSAGLVIDLGFITTKQGLYGTLPTQGEAAGKVSRGSPMEVRGSSPIEDGQRRL
jgi:hypothetical protein